MQSSGNPPNDEARPQHEEGAKCPSANKRPKLDGIDLKAIGHGGVPIIKQMHPFDFKLTEPVPFSFDEREKQKKLEGLMQKENKVEDKLGSTFRARKSPNFDRAPLLPAKMELPLTIPQEPKLSAYTYGAQNEKKFQEKVAKQELQLKENAIFHASPVPKGTPMKIKPSDRPLTEPLSPFSERLTRKK